MVLSPESSFDSQSLRSIVEYHVSLGQDGKLDPCCFLECVYPQSTSVLAVTLDDDNLECKPDKLWIQKDESGLLLVNLQVVITDRGEAKEEDLKGPRWEGGHGQHSAEGEGGHSDDVDGCDAE